MIKLIIAVCFVVLVGVIGIYQWGDCLEENSILTCARMLNK